MNARDMIELIATHGLSIECRDGIPENLRWLVRQRTRHLATGCNLRGALREADRVIKGGE